LDRRLGGPQSQSERGGEEKNSQTLQGISKVHHVIIDRQVVVQLLRAVSFLWLSWSHYLCKLQITGALPYPISVREFMHVISVADSQVFDLRGTKINGIWQFATSALEVAAFFAHLKRM
jgi:hypothetical protein